MSYERFPTWSGSTTYGALLTSSASNNTKGSYSQIAASTSADCGLYYVQFVSQTALRDMLTDIATGAAASEVVQVANIMTQSGNDASGPSSTQVMATSNIASGTRIAGRTQANSGTGPPVCSVAVFLNESVALGGRAAPTTYGVSTGTSLGTQVDPGGSANTKGSYAQLTSSTSASSTLLTIMSGLAANATPTFCQWAVDIATGAAASEVVLIPDLVYQCSDLGGDQVLPGTYNLPNVSIGSSVRVASRAACSITDASDRLIQIAIIAGTSIPTSGVAGGAWAFA